MVHTTQSTPDERWSRAYDRARKVTTTHGELDRETDHLHWILSNNSYPLPFICLTLKKSPRGWRGEDKEMEEN